MTWAVLYAPSHCFPHGAFRCPRTYPTPASEVGLDQDAIIHEEAAVEGHVVVPLGFIGAVCGVDELVGVTEDHVLARAAQPTEGKAKVDSDHGAQEVELGAGELGPKEACQLIVRPQPFESVRDVAFGQEDVDSRVPSFPPQHEASDAVVPRLQCRRMFVLVTRNVQFAKVVNEAPLVTDGSVRVQFRDPTER
jgi:hypothetical protein